MSVKDILLLGDPRLYKISETVREGELDALKSVVTDLHDTLIDFRKRHGAGRAIAAPQIGVMKRLVYIYIDEPEVFINPVLDEMSEEMIEVWDDCMWFPDLLVRVKRHKSCSVLSKDPNWDDRRMDLVDDVSELLQHEYDHLDGILAVSRAIDGRSFALKNQKHFLI